MSSIDRLLTAVERFVAAYEKAVGGSSDPVNKYVPDSMDFPPAKDEQSPPEKEKQEPKIEMAYVQYPDETDRAAWLYLCERRELKVPPRTKTPTLVKMVKAYDRADCVDDIKNAPAGTIEPKPEQKPAPVVTVHEPEQPAVEPEPAPDDKKPKKIEEADVRALLQDLMRKTNTSTVVNLLREHGGYPMLKDVPVEKYEAVVIATEEALNG